MATVNLGNIKFNWKGTYNAGTAYAIDDVVSYNGSSYVCISATTGNLPTVTAKWNVMATAGTNGTDVGTTITTQGDILYRDGSGLQRLGAGTSGQVLKTGGSGANPSWGTVSSDFVKLATGNFSTSASTIDVDGYFTSDYDAYKLYVYGMANTGHSGNTARLRYIQGGSTISSATYKYVNTLVYKSSSGGGSTNSNNWNAAYADVCHLGDSNADPSEGVIDILNPLSTSTYKKCSWVFFSKDGGSQYMQWSGSTVFNGNTTALSGIRLYTHSGNWTNAGKWQLYGIKN